MPRRVSMMVGALALVVAGSVVPAAAQASETPQASRASRSAQPAAVSLVGGKASTARLEAASDNENQTKSGYKRCRKGRVCLFTGKYGNGAIVSFRRGTTDLGDYGMNNNVSSAWNRTGKRAFIFMKKNYNGKRAILFAGDAGNVVPKFNNKASSLKVKGRG